MSIKPISRLELEHQARDHAGNWERRSWMWFEQPEDRKNWTLANLPGADTLLDASNRAAMVEEMKPFVELDAKRKNPLDGDIVEQRWGYALRVYRVDRAGRKRITKAFEKWAEIVEAMESYPVLDESDYSEREQEAAVENIEDIGKRMVAADAPEGWPYDVAHWLWENDQSQMENTDDTGAWPEDSAVRRALQALGYYHRVTESERPRRNARA